MFAQSQLGRRQPKAVYGGAVCKTHVDLPIPLVTRKIQGYAGNKKLMALGIQIVG
jgi:hypothetical protein